MSSSTGSDSNPGTQLLPWATLAKANAHVFAANDRILLKAGDTWSGETLIPNGNGQYPSASYQLKLTQDYNSNLAANLAGSVYARFNAIYLAAGFSAPAADTAARAKCSAWARCAAIETALTYTKSNASWVTVTSYGAGAHPKISPGASVNYGIKFDRTNFTGGWKFDGIDIDTAKFDGISAEVDGTASGLWIKNCVIQNITGSSVPNSGTDPQFPLAPDSNGFASTGVLADGVDNIILENVTMQASDVGCLISRTNNTMLDAITVTGTYRAGAWISTHAVGPTYPVGPSGVRAHTTNVVMRNSRVTNVGSVGMYFGNAGAEMDAIETGWIRDTEIDHILRQGNARPDGEGGDNEGGCIQFTWLRCNIHDCEGAPFLHETTAALGVNADTAYVDCTLTTNATHPDQTTNKAQLLRTDAEATERLIIDGCTVTTGGNPLYQYSQHTLPCTNTPLSNWIIGTNTII